MRLLLVTTIAIIVVLALAAERLLVAYFTWTMARRKGRLWLPYAIFGLVGYIVLALRSTNHAVLDDRPRITSRDSFTHTGFARPGFVRPEDIQEALDPQQKRTASLEGYHLPRGAITSRGRS
jgi:hypothetical protein